MIMTKCRLADEPQAASELHKKEGDRLSVAVAFQGRVCSNYLSRASWHTWQAGSALVEPNNIIINAS